MDSHAEQTVITEDVEVVGTIKAGNGLRMDGRLNGDLNCASDVSIGKSANIKGNIAVNCATVHGQITGNLVAKDRIELKAAARISGDVKAKRMVVEDGVSFVGKVEVNPAGVGGKTEPAGHQESAPEPAESERPGERGRGGVSFLGRK